MVDVAMTEGKYFWNIRLDKIYNRPYYITGVAERNLGLNSYVERKNFWGYDPGQALKYIKGYNST